ncbi:endonuclease/exonuclease/phosphatase family protein [Terricaulis sp.]|uniref:endonuclease/exonuclease/phosphatase family protein n=1 Tax=Terricaulis sp. TaxID=2768686 RepID=UPI00378357C0
MRIATFNVQNLRLREDHLDGARDEGVPLAKLSAEERALDARDRALTAQVIANADADVLALQEVFDQRTLDAFHDAHLAPISALYPHRICVQGNDGRRHVALMSRMPWAQLQSHATLNYADIGLDPPNGETASASVFRRDCLTASIGGVLILNVHFKAPSDAATLEVTRREALAVRKLIERRFADPGDARWMIIGDLNVNDVPVGDVLDVLTAGFAVDLAADQPAAERWTYFNAHYNSYARPDRVLVSPALAPLCRNFEVRREGMSSAALAYGGARLDDVGLVRPRASDHALLVVEVDV